MFMGLSSNRLVRFAAVGGSGTIVLLGITYALTELGLFYLLSYVIAFFISLVWNYLLNSRFTFGKNAGFGGLGRYGLIGLTTLGLNTVVTFILTESGLYYLLSVGVAVVMAFLVNFGLSRKYVWKKY